MNIIPENFLSKLLQLIVLESQGKVVFSNLIQYATKDVVHVIIMIPKQHQLLNIIVSHVNHPFILWAIYVLVIAL